MVWKCPIVNEPIEHDKDNEIPLSVPKGLQKEAVRVCAKMCKDTSKQLQRSSFKAAKAGY